MTKLTTTTTTTTKPQDGEFTNLLGSLREVIALARSQVLRVADSIQVHTYWQIGQHIVEFEQQGARRATFGAKLLSQLAEKLTAEFGKGFDDRALRRMRSFYQIYPIRGALRPELSWTHYRLLMRIESKTVREWYEAEIISQNWSSRALERQIGTKYYERLLLSQDKAAVTTEATENLAALTASELLNPRAFVRDPVMLEFLGLTSAGKLLESNFRRVIALPFWLPQRLRGGRLKIPCGDGMIIACNSRRNASRI